ILIEKLKIFPEELEKRQAIANFYTRELSPHVQVQARVAGLHSSFAQYTIVLPGEHAQQNDGQQTDLQQSRAAEISATSNLDPFTSNLDPFITNQNKSNNYRDKVIKTLAEKGIPTAIHYPKPLHQQLAFCNFPCAGDTASSFAAASKA